jgi:hypothetical protein
LKWWAFEGFTEVDCYLETDRFLLFVEGKRTEPLSESTVWYKGRNQLIRNLEVAEELAGTKDYGVMLISEDPMPEPTHAEVDTSLPHLSPEHRDELMKHFLGCRTWRQNNTVDNWLC